MYIRNRQSHGLGFGQWEAKEAEADNLDALARAECEGKPATCIASNPNAQRARTLRAEAATMKRQAAETAASKAAQQQLATSLATTVATVGTTALAHQAAQKQAKLDAKVRMAQASQPQTTYVQGSGPSTTTIIGIVVGGVALLGVVLVLANKK